MIEDDYEEIELDYALATSGFIALMLIVITIALFNDTIMRELIILLFKLMFK